MAKEKFPNTPLKFILRFLKPYVWYFSGLLAVALVWAADTTLGPYLVKIILDILEKTSQEEGHIFNHLKEPVLIYISLRVFMDFTNRLHDYFSLKVMPHFNKNVVIGLTKYIEKHSYAYFQNHFGGSVVSKISMVADATEAILNSLVYDFVFPFFSLLIIMFAMFTVRPFLAIILGIWVIFFIGISYRLSYRVQALSEQLSEKHTTLAGKLVDSITNILAVRLFARRKFEIKVLESAAQEKVEKSEELKWYDIKRKAVMDIMTNVLIFTLIYYLVSERQKGRISIGDFALVFALALSIVDIIWNISRQYIRFVENIGKCSQALKTMVVPHAIKDAPGASALVVTDGVIEFRDISLNYEKGNPIFKNFSLTINSNEKVGIVGYSGSGKTTLLNLIVRLWELKSGAILIDGQDISAVTQDSLHQNISFIPQEPLLFRRTILENIQYGNLEASEEEIIEAAKKAHADAFIKALPQGYRTLLGEITLSGGQRQRLAIARGILKGAKILMLDEATSALDSETESYIQESLDFLMQNKTVLVVAHRLSTLLKMDRIIVLDKGKIAEEGSHENLLQKEGIYAKLWNMQINKFSFHK